MPATIKIIHATDFIKATAEGELNLKESKRLLAAILAGTDLVDYEVILDTRYAHSTLTGIELWYLATEIRTVAKHLPRKTAILCPRERFDYAGFFALCAKNSGSNVRAFTCYEDAMEWLISDAPDPKTVPGDQDSAGEPGARP